MLIKIIHLPRWNHGMPPFALPVLTSCLRQTGNEVVPCDYDILLHRNYGVSYDSGPNTSNFFYDWDCENFLKEHEDFFNWCVEDILSGNPDVACFSIRNTQRYISLAIAERVKKLNSNIHICIGGPEGGRLKIDDYSFVDSLCYQEGEIVLPEFISYLSNNTTQDPRVINGMIYKDSNNNIVDGGYLHEFPDPEKIPLADFSDIDFTLYDDPHMIPILSSRGCINRCSYCTEHLVDRKFVSYPAERTYNEIMNALKNPTISDKPEVFFMDLLINGSLFQLNKLADMFIENPVKNLTFWAMLFPHPRMTNETIEKLGKMGLTDALYGVESGSEKVLKMMNKRVDLKEAERILKATKEAGISASAFMIVGHPGETEVEFYKSLEYFRKIAKYVSHINIPVSKIGVYPGSQLHKHPEKFGIQFHKGAPPSFENGTITQEIIDHRYKVATTLLFDKLCNDTMFDYGDDLYMPETLKNIYDNNRRV